MVDVIVKIWDVVMGECLDIIVGYMVGIFCLVWVFDSNIIVMGFDDKVIRLWDRLIGNLVYVVYFMLDVIGKEYRGLFMI